MLKLKPKIVSLDHGGVSCLFRI